MGKIIGLIFILIIIVGLISGFYIWKEKEEENFKINLIGKDEIIPTGLERKYVKSISLIDLDTQEPKLVIKFNDKGKKILKNLTQTNKGKKLTLLIDNEKVAEYKITETVEEGKLTISGFIDIEKAKSIADSIKK